MKTHEDWAHYFSQNPLTLSLPENKHIGDIDHHKTYIKEYKHVIKTIEELQAENERYEKALKKYGHHLYYCRAHNVFGTKLELACSCGFEQVLKEK